MARETEIERLVVRLVGDDKSYRAMMQNAVAASSVFEQESEAIANAQEKAQEALNETLPPLEDIHNETMRSSRSFRFLGQEVQQAGMLVSSFNAPAGMTVIVLGEMTSAAGQAMHAYKALGVTIASVGTIIKAHPYIAAIGAAAAVTSATIAVLRSRAMKEEEKRRIEAEKFYGEESHQEDRYTKNLYSAIQDEKIDSRISSIRRMASMHKIEAEEAKKAAKAVKDIYENRGLWEKGTSWFTGSKSVNKEEVDLAEAREIKLRRRYEDTLDWLKQSQREKARIQSEEVEGRSKGIISDISALQGSYAQLALSEKDAAKYAFMVKNEMLQYPNPELLAEWERTYDRLATIRITDELKSAVNLMEDMKDRNEEILDPLNSQLRITHELEKANRDYARAHNIAVENVPKEIQEKNKLIAAEREHQRLLQEGKAVYDQYKDPLDKMIESQKRLKQLFEAGGFEKGEKGARAYQKALAEAYGQAHKDYTIQFQGQQFDALIGGTHAAERALYEYKLATTAIPLDVVRASKSVAAKSKSESPSNFWSGYDDDTKATGRAMVSGIKSVAEGVRMLVEQGKNKSGQTISNANFN